MTLTACGALTKPAEILAEKTSAEKTSAEKTSAEKTSAADKKKEDRKESSAAENQKEPQIVIVSETQKETENSNVQDSSRPQVTALPKDEAAAAADFVVVSQVIPDAILEIRYHSTFNFVGDRIDGYDEPCALLTREAALALKEASDDLMAQGYRIKIYDAYRPQDAVNHFVRWAKDLGDTRMKAYFYPEVDKSQLFSSGYIAKRSGHSRGSTVDITLFDLSTGKDADMGGTFDYFGDASHYEYKKLTPEQKKNRLILRKAMTAHGFKPISTEWWHFTLVDEPYPDTYFNFPVSSEAVEAAGN
ncbi:MAG: M15 family metallopeptidase [Clostridium sp.]|nr:M15 family metallopeptidase [Clostridium sp.]